MNGDTRSIAVNLMSWARGTDASNASPNVVVSADASLSEGLAGHDFMTPGSVLFTPRTDHGHQRPETRWQVFEYVGDFTDPDADIQIGDDFYVQLQSYAVSEFVPIGGPTILRMDSDVDKAAFFRDADYARATGKFPSALLHPQSILGDLPSIGLDPAATTVRHVFLNDSGDVSTSPSGIPIGTVQNTHSSWSERWVEGVETVSRQSDNADRPWLGNYLLAADALRHAAVRGLQPMRVSGFGGHLVSNLDSVDSPVPSSTALLLFNNDVAHLHDSASSRTYKLGSDAAKFVDVMLRFGADAGAAARTLGCSEDLAAASIRQINASFAAKDIRITSTEPAGL